MGIDFIKIFDNFNLVAMIIILVIIVLRIVYFHKSELLIWLPSAIGLTFVLFLEANETLMIQKYYIGVVALTYTLVSSVIMAKIDKSKKFSAYYSFGSIFLGLFTIFTIHFGGIVNSVLTKPLFLTLMLISLVIIILVPIISVGTNKANAFVLLGTFCWVLVALAVWLKWSMNTEDFFTKVILLLGILCLGGNFVLADWNSNKKV